MVRDKRNPAGAETGGDPKNTSVLAGRSDNTTRPVARSVRATAGQWRFALRNRGLHPTAHHVALALAVYLDGDGSGARPSIARLASDTGRKPETVSAALRELEHQGWITRRRPSRRAAYRYLVTIPESPLDGGDSLPSTPSTGGTEYPPSGNRVPPAEGDDQQRTSVKTSNRKTVAPDGATTSESSPVALTGDDKFQTFWTTYPRGRSGKPGGDGPKGPARDLWRHLTPDDQQSALTAVVHYRDHIDTTGTWPLHARNWLAQEAWDDWQTPATPATPKGRSSVSEFDGGTKAVAL